MPDGECANAQTRAACRCSHGASFTKETNMNKDRIVGAAKEAKGAIKEAIGKAVGDAKLTVEGQSEKAGGKLQNAVGGAKEMIKKL